MNDKAFRRAFVTLYGTRAGMVSENENGYTFAYDSEYLSRSDAKAVSLTLPLRKEPYHSKVLFAFFDGLIPEGWLLDVVYRNWKIDPRDRFGLLIASCRDTIGAAGIEIAYD